MSASVDRWRFSCCGLTASIPETRETATCTTCGQVHERTKGKKKKAK